MINMDESNKTYELWVYRDGPKEGKETVYVIAPEEDWMRVQSFFKLELIKQFQGLTEEQGGQFFEAALQFKGPEEKFLENLEGIINPEYNR